MDEKKYKAPAAEKLLEMLELMAADNAAFTITEISQRLNISNNSVFRIMKELEAKSYVIKNPHDSNYTLTGKLYYLGMSVGRRIALKQAAEPSMISLGRKTRETVLLTQFGRNHSTVVIDQIESPEPIKFISTIGYDYPSHASAMGKAMLSFLDKHALNDFIQTHAFDAATPQTITDRERFQELLADINENGYALDLEESYIGLRCVAAPIFNAHGQIEGAIGVSGPSFRMTDQIMKSLPPIVMEEAKAVSQLLGHHHA